jgi:sialic acid synthase SpsE
VSGFSDNNGGIEIPYLAALSGASIIEKHFTLSRQKGGHDSKFSIEPEELKKLVKHIRTAERGLGKVFYGPINKLEEKFRKNRRSIFAVVDIKKGEKLTRRNIRSIRPGAGLPTKYFEEILGRVAVRNIEAGTPLAFNLIKK